MKKRNLILVLLFVMAAGCAATEPPSDAECSGWLAKQPLPPINLRTVDITSGQIQVSVNSPGSQMTVLLDGVVVYQGSGEGWSGSLTAAEGQHIVEIAATQLIVVTEADVWYAACLGKQVSARQSSTVFVDQTPPVIQQADVFWKMNTLVLEGVATDNSGRAVMVMYYGGIATTNPDGVFRLEVSWQTTDVPVMGIQAIDVVGNMTMTDAVLHLPPNRAEHYGRDGDLRGINTAPGFNPYQGLANLFGFLDGYWVVYVDGIGYLASTTSTHWLMRMLVVGMILVPIGLAVRRKFFASSVSSVPSVAVPKHADLRHLTGFLSAIMAQAVHLDNPGDRVIAVKVLHRKDVPQDPAAFVKWVNILTQDEGRVMNILLENIRQQVQSHARGAPVRVQQKVEV